MDDIIQKLTVYPMNLIMIPIQMLVAFFTVYYFILSVCGVWRKKEKKYIVPGKTFAIVVAAHNEEVVIGELIKSLQALNYPKHLYDIFIVADNCTDKTAQICKSLGVYVYERFNNHLKGKGYALEWMFSKIFKMNRNYDAVVIFDADNLVNSNFLYEMNSRLCQGDKIIQGYLDAKNPTDTWVTATFSMAFWITNRMMQLSRFNLGLSNILCGTGMCIDTGVLKKIGWGATSLTEDLEFSVKALMCGIKTVWAHDAIVYDEKPLTFMQSWYQRKRWAQGHVDIANRYMVPLILKGIKEKNIMYIDTAIHLFQPALLMILTFFMIMSFLQGYKPIYTVILDNIIPIGMWQFISLVQYVYPLVPLVLDRLPLRPYLWLLMYPVFIYSWIPIVALGFINCRKREWHHTIHTRKISYREIARHRING